MSVDSKSGAGRELFQELRLALVFNGGVSLAVWMGGVAKEIDRFRRAFSDDENSNKVLSSYRELLELLRTLVVTDVVAGASAGGINGALLSYVVANGKSLECAGPNAIRDTWQSLGSINNLLATKGDTPSILATDEVLFAGCAEVFQKLHDAQPDLSDAVSRWVRLAVTATDTDGYTVSAPTSAASDSVVTGPDHRLMLRFYHVVRPEGSRLLLSPELVAAIGKVVGETPAGSWPFPAAPSPRELAGPDAAALLARAARTTSSFPIAFFASELPLNHATTALGKDRPGDGLTATPAMAEVIETSSAASPLLAPDAPASPAVSRFAIDGGVWDNSPFSTILRSIEKTPSGRDVRRVLTYIVGTREPGPRPQDSAQPGLLGSLTKAVALPSDLGFANDLERIRADGKRQQNHRNTVLQLLSGPAGSGADLFLLAQQLFPLYRDNLKAQANEEPSIVASDLLSATELPPADASLEKWWATPGEWGWGLDAVRASVQQARSLLRSLLRAADSRQLDDSVATDLVTARERLSQLAWALDDLSTATTTTANDEKAALACGQAMADLAATANDVNAIAAELLRTASTAKDPLAAALNATATITAGGTDVIIKRALALRITLDALAGSGTPENVVDYTFTAIRPSVNWPDPEPNSGTGTGPSPDRPPLAGASIHHFGGFFRTSWRLHDWMWGRIDGNRGVINNLITRDQLTRLAPPGDTNATTKLATAIANFVNQTEPTLTPPDQTANHFIELIEAVVTGNDATALEQIRSDVARRFRHAILTDEVPDIVKASQSEGGHLPAAVDLLSNPSATLYQLTPDLLCTAPSTLELIQDGENAVANALYAFNHKPEGAIIRTMALITTKTRAWWHALRLATHYARKTRK